MQLQKEIEKLIIDQLRKTIPVTMKQGADKQALIDNSTSVMGFKKITRKGYTP